MNIRICGTGSALPERKITNDDLSQIMDTSDEWISSRTGIKTRHPVYRKEQKHPPVRGMSEHNLYSAPIEECLLAYQNLLEDA